MQLDDERLEALRSWGKRLRQAGGEESAAAGRAILMLVEEIDRLHTELAQVRPQPSGEASVEAEVAAEVAEEPVATSLHARLQRALRRDAALEDVRQPGPQAEIDAPTSAQDWIAALRREK